MKTYISISIAIVLATSRALAITPSFDHPDFSASSWDQHSEGIEVAMVLKTTRSSGVQLGQIDIFIKNMSTTDKYYFDDHIDSGVELFYVNQNGTLLPLHNYHPAEPEMIDSNVKRKKFVMKPQTTLKITVKVDQQDLFLIGIHPITCKVLIYDPTTKTQYAIESAPKILTEAVAK